MLDRVRIWTLREAGHTLERIAAEVGVGKRSVQRVLKQERITSPEAAPTPRSRGIGRPNRVEAFGDDVRRILQDEPSLPTVEILSRLGDLGYTGGKSAVYELVRSLRPKPVRAPEVRFEGVPGEFSQHDFGSVTVTYADGSGQKLQFFASRLKYSRWTHVVLVTDQKVEALIRALLKSFESFGGVPLRAVFDNPKTVVTSRNNGFIEWNPTFAHVYCSEFIGMDGAGDSLVCRVLLGPSERRRDCGFRRIWPPRRRPTRYSFRPSGGSLRRHGGVFRSDGVEQRRRNHG